MVNFVPLLYPRNIRHDVLAAGRHGSVLIITRARQTGKSTLAQGMFPPADRPEYLSFDDIESLAAIKEFAKDFSAKLSRTHHNRRDPAGARAVLAHQGVRRQEVRAGNVHPDRFLQHQDNADLCDSLAGRLDIHTLWPLSQSELSSFQAAISC
jgi:uncharacterized protein